MEQAFDQEMCGPCRNGRSDGNQRSMWVTPRDVGSDDADHGLAGWR
jgi:hypothetical protein